MRYTPKKLHIVLLMVSALLLFLFAGKADKSLAEAVNRTSSTSVDSALEIKDITFQIKSGREERILLHMNRYFWPSVLHDFNTENPLLEIVLMPAHSISKKLDIIPVNGDWIRRVRTRYLENKKMLIVSLDLYPANHYTVAQHFNNAENYFLVGVTASKRVRITEGPRVTQPRTIPSHKEKIATLVTSWKGAWEKKDLNAYITFYHTAFQSDDKDLAAWERGKERVFDKYQRIIIALSDLRIHVTGDGARATFRQHYQADTYQDVGYKQLELRKEGEDWRIYREEWFPERPDNRPE